MKRWTERLAPVIGAVATTCAWMYYEGRLPASDSFLSSSITLGAILTGFLATAKSVLLAFDKKIMKAINSTGFRGVLVSYFGHAIWLCLSFTCVGLLGYFVDASANWYGYLWIALAAGAIVAFIRVIRILLLILSHPDN